MANVHKFGEISYGIKFNVDSQSIQNLKKSLQDIQNMTTSQYQATNPNASRDLKTAMNELVSIKKEANEVQTALNKAFNPGLGTTNITKFSQELKNINLEKLYKNISLLGSTGQTAFRQLNTSLVTTNIQLKESNKLLDKMAITMANTIRFGISSSIFNNLTGSIQKAWNYTKNLDNSLNDIRIVSGQSADEMERLAKQANKTAQALGNSTLDYTKAALIYYQQGLKGDDVSERTEITLKMANVLRTSASEVSDYMTAIWNNFASGTETLEHYADVITALGAATAASSEEIATGLEKFSAISKTVGLSYEYATTALATVVATTRQSADVVGTAFKTLFARIQDLEQGNTLEDGTTLGKYAEALEKVGINIKDQQGELKSMNDILDEMGKKWQTLSKDQQVALAQNVAGTRQYTQLVALMDNWDTFNKNLDVAKNSTGTLQKQQETYLESTQAHLEKLGAAVERVMAAFVDNKGINSMIDGLTNIIKLLSNLIESVGGGGNALLMLGSIGTQVFGTQISQGIGVMLRNLERSKQAAQETKTVIDNLFNSLKSNYGQQDIVIEKINKAQTRLNKVSGVLDQKDLQLMEQYIQEMSQLLDKSQKTRSELKIAIDNIKDIGGMGGSLNSKDQSQMNDPEKRIELAEQAYQRIYKAISGYSTEEKELQGLRENSVMGLQEYSNWMDNIIEKHKDIIANINREEEVELKGVERRKQVTQSIKTTAGVMKSYVQAMEDYANDFKQALPEEDFNKIISLTEQLKKKLSDPKEYIEKYTGNNGVIRQRFSKDLQEQLFNPLENIVHESAQKLQEIANNAKEIVIKAGKDSTIDAENQIDEEIDKIMSKFDILAARGEKVLNIKNITDFASGLGQITSGFTTFLNLFKVWNNEDLSTTEKLLQIISGISIAFPMVAHGMKLFISNGKQVIITLTEMIAGRIKDAIAAYKEAAANGTLAASFQGLGAAIKAALGPIALIAIATVALTIATIKFVQELQKVNSEEYNRQKQLEASNEKLKEMQEKYEDFKTTLSTYQDARAGIDKLTEGTVDFYEAVVKSNEQANKLIETLGLIQGSDYTIGANGLITIKEQSLEKGQYEQSRKFLQEQADNAYYQYRVNQLKREKKLAEIVNNFTIDVNKNRVSQISNEQGKTILSNINNTSPTGLGEVATSVNNNFKTVIGNLINALTHNSQETNEKITQVGGDVSDAIKKYGPEYQKILAEEKNEKFQITSKALYGQMDQNQNKTFSELNETGKTAVITAFENPLEDARNKAINFSESQSNRSTKLLDEVYKYKDNPLMKLIVGTKHLDPLSGLAVAFGGLDQDAENFTKNRQRAIAKNTEKNSEEPVKKLFDQIKEVTDKIQSIPGLSDTSSKQLIGATLASQNKTLTKENLNKLTEQELLTAKENNLFTNLPEGVNNLDEVLTKLRENMDEFGRSAQRITEDLASYNTELKSQAEALGTTETALKLYGDAMAGAGKLTKKLDQDTAKATANSYKFNKSYNEGRQIYADNKKALEIYSKALNKNQEVSYDVADAVGEIVDKLQEMNIYLTSKDLKSASTLKNINKLLKGTEKEAKEAYKELYNLSRLNALEQAFGKEEDIAKQFKGLGDLIGKSVTKPYQMLLDEIDRTPIGENLNNQYAAALSNMIQNTHMTVNEINKLADQLGIEIPVEYKYPESFDINNVQFTTKGSTTVHRYKGKMVNPGWKGEGDAQYVDVDYSWTETVEDKTEDFLVPKSTNFKVTNTKQNVSSGKNFKSGLGGSKSGGSKNEPNKKDPIEAEIDRYHKVNTQIQKVDNTLKKLTSQQDKFVGSKLIKNLNSQWDLLNKQISNYNEKLKIAKQEQSELANTLKSKGVVFNVDGTVSNYAEAIKSQEAYMNSLINHYNSLSANAQEKYEKNVLEPAQKAYDKFLEDIDRYDELVSDFIPGLQQSIQDSLDQQIEINIKKFNMEIEITLNMDQATRDWNAWVKRAIDGFDADNIFGNAQARLKDFYTYFNENGTADAQVGTRHVNNILAELTKMDRGQDNIYGDNRSQALEDLKTYYTQLMQSITDVIELQDELHQDVLDEMDEVQDKFSKQISQYEYLRDILNHDIKVIQMTLGDDAYGEMAKFYQMQQDNYEKQLDFQRQQKDFWYAQMQAAEEGSKEWDSAREKWQEAVNEFNSILEEGLENARQKFENTINDIFKRLNKSVTSGMGLDYVQTQWDLINQNADRYLDTINTGYAIRQLESKYIKSINDSSSINVQQRLKKLMDEQLTNLKEKDKLTQYDVDRANKLYELELARIALEEAQQNKSKMRLRRDSQGNYSYQYIADEDAINDAEDKLSMLYNDLYNFDKERYKNVLDDIYSIWDSYQQAMAEAALINDPQLRAEKELLIQEQYNELMTQAVNDYETSKYNLEESFFWDWIDLNDQGLEKFKNFTEEEKNLMLTEMIPIWENGVSKMAEVFSGPGGFAEQTQDSWNEIKHSENEYAEDMEELENIAGQTFDTIINGEDESINKAKDLIKENSELIDAYKKELAAVQQVYEKVKQLRQEYDAAYNSAIKAAKAAYEYEQRELKKQQSAAKAQSQTTSSANSSNVSTNTGSSSSGSGSSSSGGSGGGDGVLSVGDTATFVGGRYYGDSYGGGGSGSRGPGKKVKVTIVKNDNRPYPIHVTSSDSAYGWLRRDQLTGYDTGGYTGSWDNSGRLAMLHQKELVLNAQDTENMLNTVAIMRSLAYSLGSSMLERLAGVSASNINSPNSGDLLEQNVHIDASFPNVKNATEIEEALNNLVNAASQRIMEDR